MVGIHDHTCLNFADERGRCLCYNLADESTHTDQLRMGESGVSYMLIYTFDACVGTLCKAQELRSRTQHEKVFFAPNRAGVKTPQYVHRLNPNTGKCRSKSNDKVAPVGLC